MCKPGAPGPGGEARGAHQGRYGPGQHNLQVTKTYCLAAPRLPGQGGGWGLRSDWGGPTLLDCRTAQVVLPDGRGQRPMACACHRGN